MNLKKTLENNQRMMALSFAVVAFLTGCGGVPEGYIDEFDETIMVHRQVNYGTANQAGSSPRPGINAGAIGSSFTLNSIEDFRGFNPEIWNGRKSWYECNCGNSQPELPRKMPWNTAG